MILKVENLTKKFEGLVAVNDVDFHVNKNEIVAIIGPNGAGKSSLFNLISGALRSTSGHVYLEDKEITNLKPHHISRNGIARTFQTTSLFEQLRVIDNLVISYQHRTASGFWRTLFRTPMFKKDKETTTEKAKETLDFIDLKEKGNNFVSTLTQEEQKRLAIGVALVSEPKIVMLDEPTAGLIPEETSRINKLIYNIRDLGITVCIIEHKMKMIMGMADRIIVLNYGSKIAEGTPEEIKNDPAVIKAYLGGENIA